MPQDSKISMQTNPKSKWKIILMALGVVLLAANLRAPLTSVGPVLGEISKDLGLSKTAAGLLTTIPLMSFALLSSFSPRLAKRYGMETILLLSVVVLMIGLLVRSIGNISFLFIGAGLIGIAITIGNVIMPAYIKKHFPENIGLLTGVYSVSLNLVAALAAGFSIQLGAMTQLGWKGSIGVWSLLSLVALFIWVPLTISSRKSKTDVTPSYSNHHIWKSRLAWYVALFMGLQSFIYYCIITWWPEMFVSWGASDNNAGWIVSYVQLAQLPVTFVVPIIAHKMKNQKPLIFLIGIFIFIALFLLVVFKGQFLILANILLGASTGAAFALAMMFFVLRTKDANDAASLSGMSQSVGYLLAATGPPLFGMIYEQSQDWKSSLLLLFLISAALIYTGYQSAQNKII